MKTLILDHEKMGLILNIQGMRRWMEGKTYNQAEDFDRLSPMSVEELRELQDETIPQYNEAIRSQNGKD